MQAIYSSGFYAVQIGSSWRMGRQLASGSWQLWGSAYDYAHEAIAAWYEIQQQEGVV